MQRQQRPQLFALPVALAMAPDVLCASPFAPFPLALGGAVGRRDSGDGDVDVDLGSLPSSSNVRSSVQARFLVYQLLHAVSSARGTRARVLGTAAVVVSPGKKSPYHRARLVVAYKFTP